MIDTNHQLRLLEEFHQEIRFLHSRDSEWKPQDDLQTCKLDRNLSIMVITHIVLPDSRKINYLCYVILVQNFLGSNARPLENSRRSKCTRRDHNQPRSLDNDLARWIRSSVTFADILYTYSSIISGRNQIKTRKLDKEGDHTQKWRGWPDFCPTLSSWHYGTDYKCSYALYPNAFQSWYRCT